MSRWEDELLAFWLGLGREAWFKADPVLDREVRKRFLDTWERERENVPEHFLGTAEDALAACILFDQLPRNMFRGHAEQFSTDPLARAVAVEAIGRGYDKAVPAEHRPFFYYPFEHSEDADDQRRSLLLFTALGDAEYLRHARLHHDVIARFGRFPHRNAMLGRQPRAEEEAAGEVVPW